MMEFPRSPENHAAAPAMPMSLRAEKFWEGPEQVLDVVVATPSVGGKQFYLLAKDGVLIRQGGSDEMAQVRLPALGQATRDPKGRLTLGENRVQVRFGQEICTIVRDSFSLQECNLSADPFSLMNTGAMVNGACGTVYQFLSAGPGDYTQKDYVQLFDAVGTREHPAGTPMSDPIYFAGPVMSLGGAANQVSTIVHNLDTGNYEAYTVLISSSCGQ
jgi:hypothetical protein